VQGRGSLHPPVSTRSADTQKLFDQGSVLRPWRLWTADGKPEEGTPEIVTVLESLFGLMGALNVRRPRP